MDDNDVWRVGFITQDDMTEFGLVPIMWRYTFRWLILLQAMCTLYRRRRVKPITNISAAQSMKFAVSGGVTDVLEPGGEIHPA